LCVLCTKCLNECIMKTYLRVSVTKLLIELRKSDVGCLHENVGEFPFNLYGCNSTPPVHGAHIKLQITKKNARIKEKCVIKI